LAATRSVPGIYAVLVGLLILFVLFQAPVHCGAINRKRGGGVEFCRNNSTALVMGCHLRQHKWQKFGRDWWSLGWREKSKGTWTEASAKLATASGLVGTVTGIIGVSSRCGVPGGPEAAAWPARSSGTDPAQLRPRRAVKGCQTTEEFAQVTAAISPFTMIHPAREGFRF
jgi:hypothetical protein